MKFNRLNIRFLLIFAFVGASQPMHGMSYLKAAYNAAVNYWYGKPKQQEPALSLQPKSAEELESESLKQDFEKLIKFGDGKALLARAIHQFDPATSQYLIRLCLENFQEIIKLKDGLKILNRLPLQYVALTKLLIRPCIDNFQTIINSDDGIYLLWLLAFFNKDNAELLMKPCLENVEKLIESNTGLMLLEGFAKNTGKLLAKTCIENFKTIIKFDSGLSLLFRLVKDKNITEGLLAEPCIESFDYLAGTRLGRDLLRVGLNNEQMKFEIKKLCDIDFNCEKRLPTLLHITAHMPINDLAKFVGNNELKDLLKSVIIKEQQLSDDYYTFVHGQRKELYLSEKIYTHLWQLKKKRTIPGFFFAHVKDLVESPDDITYEKIQKHFILSHGNYDNWQKGQVDARLKLLFMNYALFANAQNLGSNTAYYVLNDVNANSFIDLSPLDLFRMFGYQEVCDEKLRTKIKALCQEYKDASKYGNLLFIAVPKDKIHKYVYLADGSGPKRSIEIEGIGRISDIRIIMDTLLNAPHKIKDTDQLEFCLIMMQHKGGLDPNTGIKIMPILSGDPKKLEELKKKEDELLAEITQRVQDFERREQALTRAAVLSKHMDGSTQVKIQSRL